MMSVDNGCQLYKNCDTCTYKYCRINKQKQEIEKLRKSNRQLKEFVHTYNYKIEQGTLIELPCKVGDTVYGTDGISIYETKIAGLVYDGIPIAFSETAIGKSIFLTREEAEKQLEELQNG